MTSQRSTQSSLRNRVSRAGALGAAALAAAALPSSAAAGPGGGTGTWVWALAAVGAAVLVFTLVRLRGGLRRATHTVSDMADGRELLIARGRRVTEALTELAEAVAEREDEGATKQHARALETVSSARARIGRSSGTRVMAKAHEELDEAEWLIGVLGARLDGFVEPLRPRAGLPATCFFDGQHGLATVEVDLEGMALQRVPVRACAACAVGLVRGERPHVGSVTMGGRSVPWPAAPRWCGSYAWAVKDLKHLRYDGSPLFAPPERPVGQRRQTVAERARGVRARVLPPGPEVLPEDELEEIEEFGTFADDPAASREQDEQLESSPLSSSAFAAMGGEAEPDVETAPVAASDTPPE
ncbi:MAG TPA: hypothetical protein VFD90_18905 [Gaiellales bacterium]|nr:hypothetical protein [Gaiellales bacterium]